MGCSGWPFGREWRPGGRWQISLERHSRSGRRIHCSRGSIPKSTSTCCRKLPEDKIEANLRKDEIFVGR